MGIFKPSGGSGTRYLYYFNVDAATPTVSRIGRIDIDAGTPTNTQNWKTDLNFDANTASTYINRPMIPFKDGLYFGHMNSVGYIRDDQASDVLYQANDLDPPEDRDWETTHP